MNGTARILTKSQLLNVNKNARNGFKPEMLDIDPEGISLAKPLIDHDDGRTMRCQMFIKLVDSDQPAVCLLDIDMVKFCKLITVKAYQNFQEV